MSKNKISGKVLVIQLGSQEMQILLMGNNAEILHSLSLPIPAGAVEDGMIWNEEAVRELLKEAIKKPELKHVRQAVFTLYTSQVISETITTPDLPAAKLEKLIEANADMYFPVDTHDYKMVWQVVGPKNNGLKELDVQLWAIPTNMIERYYRVANDCGLSVRAIDYCGHSAATAIGAAFSKPGKAGKAHKKLDLNMELSFGRKKAVEPVEEEAAEEEKIRHAVDTDLHLLLERNLLGMTFVQAGQVVFQRFIRCGNDPAYQFSEIAMMVEYFRTMEIGRGSTVSGIVSGYYADNIRMVDELCDVLGIPLIQLETAYDPRYILCVGAVHTELDFGNPSLNKVATTSQRMRGHLWQYGALLACALAVLAVVMMLLTSRLTWDTEISRLESQQQMLQIQAQKTAGFADNYYDYESQYNAYSQDWDTVFASLYAYNDNLAQVMDELEKILPETASVTNMQISATGLNVEFACESKEDAAYLIMALRNMKYIDTENLMVSDLTGGGSGPATSYGTGESAPKVGSGTVDVSALTSQIASDLSDPYTVGYYLGLGRDVSVELLEDLVAAYGITPSSGYNSLEDVNADFDTRAAAFREMCTTNPYAMYMAEQLIMENTDSELGALLQEEDIFWDNVVGWKNHKSPEDLQADIEGLLALLLTDEMVTAAEKFGATEALIADDLDAEMWYLYYLDAEINGDASAPYLDTNAAATGLVSDRNDSGSLDSAVNAQLYSKVLTESTKKKLKPEDYIGSALKAYLANGTAGDDQMNSYIEGYLAIRSSGDPYVDAAIAETFESGSVNAEIAVLVEKSYGEAGSTGYAVVDALLTKAKSENNVTGISAFDTAIAAYLDSQNNDNTTESTCGGDTTESTGGDDTTESTGSDDTTESTGGDDTTESTGDDEKDEYEKMLEDYLTNGTTNDPVMDAQIKAVLASGAADKYLQKYVEKYFKEGTTGNEVLNAKIEAYDKNGTSTGIEQLDKAIDEYKKNQEEEPPTETTESNIEEYIDQALKLYLQFGTTGNAQADAYIEDYLRTGTTGDPEMDKTIEDYLNAGNADKELAALLDAYYDKGTTGIDAIDDLIKEAEKNRFKTGIDAVDQAIVDYFLNKAKDADDRIASLEEKIKEASKKAKEGAANGAGGKNAVEDDRYRFSAILGYTDELREAELQRKGLSEDDKIAPLEVGE